MRSLQLFLIISILFIPNILATEIKDNDKNSKNISYSSSNLKILPLLKLKDASYKAVQDIIFIHPPKVGGTNVVYAIEAFKTIKSNRFAVAREEGRSPILITSGWVGGLANLKNKCNDHISCNDYNFISGHFPYGVHKYLSKKYKYVTLIRNPIDREISSVNFDHQRGYIKNQEQARKYILEVMIDNPQTRLMAGEEYMTDPCTDETLKRAIQNIDNDFLLVGITEDTDSFIQVLLTLLNLEPIAIGKSQVTFNKVFTEVPLDIRHALTTKHKYDIILYKYVKERWNKWKQKNILYNIRISDEREILTILPEYANNHLAVYKTITEIEEFNSMHSNAPLIQIKQNHEGLDNKKAH